jgi:uncharacterized membrane protein
MVKQHTLIGPVIGAPKLPPGTLLMHPVGVEEPPASDRRAYRMTSIDLLRGFVIVVMALDHVRDYVMAGSMQDPITDPATGPLLFATRWITHFCAPAFVFLAGTSVGLMARRKSRRDLARFLLLRGLWLIALEVVVVSTATSFAPMGITELGGRTYVGLQVIWAIGTGMVALAGAQYLGLRACFAIGAAIAFGHNLLDVGSGRHRALPVSPVPYGSYSTRASVTIVVRCQSISPIHCYPGSV